jgi:hypothetical protein
MQSNSLAIIRKPTVDFRPALTNTIMPTISRFFGITIRMYFNDHGLPHFHAYYGGHAAKIEIETLRIVEGHLPRHWA